MAENLFTSQTPSNPDIIEGSALTLATTVSFAVAGTVDGGRFYAPVNIGGGTYVLVLYQVVTDDNPSGSGTGTLLGTATFAPLTFSAWNSVSFASPISVSTGVAYRIGVRTSEGRYTATNAFFNGTDLANGNITAWHTGADPVGVGNLDNGSFGTDVTSYPNQTFSGTCYFVDPTFTATAGGSTYDVTGTVAGTGAVSGTQALTIPATGTVTGTGVVSGTSVLTTTAAGSLAGTGAASGALTLASDSNVVTAGSWWGLKAVLDEARALAWGDRNMSPVACPHDGEPLQAGPDGMTLHCPFDGYTVSAPAR